MSLHPTNELVAVAWLRDVVPAVATELPADNTTWAASGFVQVATLGSGQPEPYLPVRTPIVSCSCWAVSPGRDKPPWGLANHLAELIRYATLDHDNVPRLLNNFPGDYTPARVLSAYLTGEPVRVRGDLADYAMYSVDLALRWVEVP